jgi:hypothetical protein
MGEDDNGKGKESELNDIYGKLDEALGIDKDQVSIGVSDAGDGKTGAEAETPQKPVEKAATAEKALTDEQAAEKYPTLARTIKILAEREAAVERAEKQVKQVAPVGNRELMLEFKRDPITALSKVGFTQEQAAQVLRVGLAKQLGDKAPDNYKKLLNDTQLDTKFEERDQEIQALREEIRQRDTQAAQAAYISQYQNELSTHLKGVETEAPLVYRMFSKNPQKATERVMAIVMQDAREKIAAGKRDAQPLTQAEACKRLNEQLDELSDVFDTKNAQVPATKNGNDGSVNLSNKTMRPVAQAAAAEGEIPFRNYVDAYMKSKGW